MLQSPFGFISLVDIASGLKQKGGGDANLEEANLNGFCGELEYHFCLVTENPRVNLGGAEAGRVQLKLRIRPRRSGDELYTHANVPSVGCPDEGLSLGCHRPITNRILVSPSRLAEEGKPTEEERRTFCPLTEPAIARSVSSTIPRESR